MRPHATSYNAVKDYTYDASGKKTSFRLRFGNLDRTVSYTYDHNNRLKTVTDGSDVTTYNYNTKGQLSSRNTKTGTTTITASQYTYNLAGLPITKVNKRGSTSLESYSMTYYANGNMQSVTLGSTARSYEYDLSNRLTKETVGTDETSYSYDSFGNRTGKTTADATTAYVYDSNNRLTSMAETAGNNVTTHSYTYDDNGNMLSDTVGLDANTYVYSPLNRLISATGTTTATYTYDGNGLCQTKTKSGVTTRHIYDGSDLVCDKTGTSNPAFFTRGAELISFDSSSGTRRYYHTNPHGDISKITNGTTTYKTYTFDAFGNLSSGSISYNGSNFGYCGEYYDPDVPGVYLRARYYSPVTGRFLAEDPHWNTSNMIYGDNQKTQKIILVNLDEQNTLTLNIHPFVKTYASSLDDRMQIYTNKKDIDVFGLNVRLNHSLTELINNSYENQFGVQFTNTMSSYVVYDVIKMPDVHAITQSSNLYAYCGNNPITYYDPSGEGWGSTVVTTVGTGMIIASFWIDGTIFGAPAGAVVGTAGTIVTYIGYLMDR